MARRSYHQYCAAARALDVIGDRWNLLIVRNLLLGPQSWSELRDGLPGIAKNLLSDRLKQLIGDEIVSHVDGGYALTPIGRELEPVVFAIANWGERHLMGPPDEEEAIRLRYLMTSIRRKLRPSPQAGTLQLFIEGAPFCVQLGTDPEVLQGESDADAKVRCKLGGIRALVFERTSVVELAEVGLLSIEGDPSIVEMFRDSLR